MRAGSVQKVTGYLETIMSQMETLVAHAEDSSQSRRPISIYTRSLCSCDCTSISVLMLVICTLCTYALQVHAQKMQLMQPCLHCAGCYGRSILESGSCGRRRAQVRSVVQGVRQEPHPPLLAI